MKKIAIVSTHPIQYNAPWFKLLAQRMKVEVKVFYTWSQAKDNVYDPGFERERVWDIDLLSGYSNCFVKNVSTKPGSHHYNGINNPSLIKEIESYNPDFLLVFGWNFKSHLSVIRYFHKRIKILFRGDSTLLNEPTGLKKIARTLVLKWVYKHVDYALSVGTHNRLYYLRHGIGTEQIVFAPHAVDNERFSKFNNEHEQAALKWRQELKIFQNEIIVLYAGKMEEVKNIDLILDIADQFVNAPIRFVIVGNGRLEKIIKKKTRDNNQFIFIDFQNQSKMPIVYRLADIFIMPSKSETWGLAINEAMASSRPVLVSDRCGCAIDLVKDGINGYKFSIEIKEYLITRLTEMVRDKNTLKRMGEKSSEIIQSWSFENICESIENLVC